MNKKLIGLILLLALPLAAVAEMDAASDSSKRVERMTKDLGLSAEQQTKVQAIFDAQKEKMKAIHEETQTSLQAVFTPEQLSKFKAIQEKRKQAYQEQMGKK